MSLSRATLISILVATAAASSSSVDSRCLTATGALDVICLEELESDSATLGYVSLMQSSKTLLGGITDPHNDPLGDLTDEFDANMVMAPIVSAGSGLGLEDSVSIDDVQYWLKFCFHIATFAVVVMIFERSKEKKIKAAAASRLSSPKCSGAGPVDFGPLMTAATSGDEVIWRSLLEKIPDVTSAKDLCGCTALHVAAHAGSVRMAQELIDRGADVNAREAWEETPLHIAAREDAVSVCRLLLQHGAELNPTDASDRTPLLSAGHAGKQTTCAFLLEKGGHCGGVAESEIPKLLSGLLLCRMIAPPIDAE